MKNILRQLDSCRRAESQSSSVHQSIHLSTSDTSSTTPQIHRVRMADQKIGALRAKLQTTSGDFQKLEAGMSDPLLTYHLFELTPSRNVGRD